MDEGDSRISTSAVSWQVPCSNQKESESITLKQYPVGVYAVVEKKYNIKVLREPLYFRNPTGPFTMPIPNLYKYELHVNGDWKDTFYSEKDDALYAWEEHAKMEDNKKWLGKFFLHPLGSGEVDNRALPYHKYQTFDSRLTTFKKNGWSKPFTPSAELLVEAGFVCTGDGDKVFCFACGIQLSNWEPWDTAWGEHKRWSPGCKFLKMCKNTAGL